MYWYGHGMGAWGWALMTIGQVLFWGLVIAGIVLLVRYVGRRSRETGPPGTLRQTPEQLLAERFARGEISEEEYRRGLDVLRQHHSAPGS